MWQEPRSARRTNFNSGCLERPRRQQLHRRSAIRDPGAGNCICAASRPASTPAIPPRSLCLEPGTTAGASISAWKASANASRGAARRCRCSAGAGRRAAGGRATTINCEHVRHHRSEAVEQIDSRPRPVGKTVEASYSAGASAAIRPYATSAAINTADAGAHAKRLQSELTPRAASAMRWSRPSRSPTGPISSR